MCCTKHLKEDVHGSLHRGYEILQLVNTLVTFKTVPFVPYFSRPQGLVAECIQRPWPF